MRLLQHPKESQEPKYRPRLSHPFLPKLSYILPASLSSISSSYPKHPFIPHLLTPSNPLLRTIHHIKLPILRLPRCRPQIRNIRAPTRFCAPQHKTRFPLIHRSYPFIFLFLRPEIHDWGDADGGTARETGHYAGGHDAVHFVVEDELVENVPLGIFDTSGQGDATVGIGAGAEEEAVLDPFLTDL